MKTVPVPYLAAREVVHWPSNSHSGDIPMRALALLAAVAAVAGCSSNGPKLYPTTGKVTVKGQAAEGALVVFHPKGNDAIDALRPSGTVGADGTFTLVSGPDANGAPAGEYEVAVVWDAPPPPPKGKLKGMGGEGEAKEVGDRLRGRYKNPKTSGLTATVTAGPTQVPTFDLK